MTLEYYYVIKEHIPTLRDMCAFEIAFNIFLRPEVKNHLARYAHRDIIILNQMIRNSPNVDDCIFSFVDTLSLSLPSTIRYHIKCALISIIVGTTHFQMFPLPSIIYSDLVSVVHPYPEYDTFHNSKWHPSKYCAFLLTNLGMIIRDELKTTIQNKSLIRKNGNKNKRRDLLTLERVKKSGFWDDIKFDICE